MLRTMYSLPARKFLKLFANFDKRKPYYIVKTFFCGENEFGEKAEKTETPRNPVGK